jgi:signal transduction histidine kinase
MRVVALNGRNVSPGVVLQPLREAELLSPNGQTILAQAMAVPMTVAGRTFLWLTGGMFALLGAVVLVRRPDDRVARFFALFASLVAVALGVSPASGGPHSPWSLVVQFLSLLGVAASLPAFATAFVDEWSGPRTTLGLFWLAGGILLFGYLLTLVVHPSLYAPVRVAFAIYLVAGILAALFLLARKMLLQRPPGSALDARLALTGVSCGTLPFVGLTLVPQILFQTEIAPGHLTALLWGLIPLTFAYAILRHEVLGIRRLVHHGMVHAVATTITLVAVFLLIVLIDSRVAGNLRADHPAWVTATLLAIGALLFHVLSRAARTLVDRLLYPGGIDSGVLLAAIRDEFVGGAHVEEAVAAIVKRIRESLRLEAAILFLGTTDRPMRVAASSGSRADECVAHVRPRLSGLEFDGFGMSETRWKSDALVIARLETAGCTVGFLVLGPKEEGEVLLREERRLIGTIAPILALAIRETSLLAELREVSEQLTDAVEAERSRIARDLHDGPLQKAILLGGVADVTLRDRDAVARELATELRELCARLRPAILDDLGLVAALEWLLEQTAKGFTVTPSLTLRGMTEEDRLPPNAELALFRVTQEAVSNALKHGHARSIHVALTRTIDSIELSIIDDGHGDGRAVDRVQGSGITGMRERLRQVGGGVSIASDPARGTVVSARIPCMVHGGT